MIRLKNYPVNKYLMIIMMIITRRRGKKKENYPKSARVHPK